MSTLVAQTISNGTVSTSSANVIQGSAKAWVNFNGGNGNTAGAINASYNVSSITVNGTGDYSVNFTNAFADGNYSAVVSGQREATGGNISHIANISNSTTNFQTTYIRVGFANDAGGSTNALKMCVTVNR